MDKAKEIQALLDQGYKVTSIGRKLNIHHEAVSRIIRREGLEVYEPFDLRKDKKIATNFELHGIFTIDDKHKVVFNKEEYDFLNMNREIVNKQMRDVRGELEKDAIDSFLSSYEPDEITVSLLKSYLHIETYIYKHYGTVNNFRESHNLDENLIYYSSDRARSFAIKDGITFEKILGESLEIIYGDSLSSQKTFGSCRPDFVINGKWHDAKLSKSTALSSGDDTIQKYLKHTDDLTIIYAIDDGADTSKVEDEYNVTFKHVSEFYEDLTDDAIYEIEAFIKRASSIKGISL